ncbi:hypothetical protein SAMN05444362_11737 [Dysgonomonas macrotermitis]|uniref:Surface antigen n=2 Tax=Dysgonomonas macrotermitis TaxID=1346286 RepID=A0A1M5HTV2_9BACT|nr:hypothetical protein SAMN05444362_11737 [Dysgonomonas macrotermitis]
MSVIDRKLRRNLRIVSVFVLLLYGTIFTQLYGEKRQGEEPDFILKSIYPKGAFQHSDFYNTLWGTHYRDIYLTPVRVPIVDLLMTHGGLSLVKQVPHANGLFMKNAQGELFLIKLVGGSTTFWQSSFFQDIYNKKEFKETYLDKFIGDAYTITNPYSFLVADHLASDLNLSSYNPHLYYIPKNATTDTVADGTCISDRLVALYDLKAFSQDSTIRTTDEVLKKMRENKSYFVDQEEYIRECLLAMLIGDWNRIPENWRWREKQHGDSLVFSPIVIDRNHAFTKVDGLFLKPMLGVLNLGSISNYDDEFKKAKRSNSLGLALDVTLTSRSGKDVWLKEAKLIQSELTDGKINEAFDRFPEEIRGAETEKIKSDLKKRKSQLAEIAGNYYDFLQKTPVIVGTTGDDHFEIEQLSKDSLLISISNDSVIKSQYQKVFNERSSEIWIYGLDGDDRFEVKGDRKKSIPVLLIGGKGNNSYNVEDGNRIKIYDYKNYKKEADTLNNAKVLLTDVESVHQYDYQKLKYSTFDFTPMGIYDSDLGLSLGAYATYTMYGFKRVPYTYRHRLGFNYAQGFSYLGFFPPFDERFNLIVQASLSTPNNFYNFFGFGNHTPGYKDEKNSFNQVKIDKYNIAPSLYWRLNEKHRLVGTASFELFQLKDKYDEGRYINQIYEHGDPIFKSKTFLDLGLTYEIGKELSETVSKVQFSTTLGWKLNLGEADRNFTYWKASGGVNVNITDRLVFATELNGNVLFTDKYEFYQASTVKLRGYRDNRFVGKQSYYQFTDLRLDLGRLDNPFTPLDYGIFAGFDYGRVWYPEESSKDWHTSCGGGFWLTFFKKYTGKFSYFGSKDGGRFYINLGMGF